MRLSAIALIGTAGLVAVLALIGTVILAFPDTALAEETVAVLGGDPRVMQWGFAASPILHRDKVILQVDIHDGAYVAAWDLKTCKRLWNIQHGGTYEHRDPLAYENPRVAQSSL